MFRREGFFFVESIDRSRMHGSKDLLVKTYKEFPWIKNSGLSLEGSDENLAESSSGSFIM